MKSKKQEAITLIALVITIIVLLILAGISIQLITNKNLLEQTKQAELKHKRGQITEWLNIKLIEEQTKNAVNLNNQEESIIESTRNNIIADEDELKQIGKDVIIEDIRNEENGQKTGDYFYVIVDEDVYKVDENGVEFIGETTQKTGSVTELTTTNTKFTYSPAQGTWTNGSVTATVSTTVTGYTLQTSKDGTIWTSANTQTFTTNGTVYARLWDGTSYGGAASGNVTNIDTAQPTGTISTESNAKTITVTVTANDVEATSTNGCSGIKGYYYSIDNGASYTSIQQNNSYTFTGLTQGTTYNIKAKVEDNAGNILDLNTTKDTLPITLALSSTSGTVVDGAYKTATISGSNYGTLSVTSSNTSVATASISGTTLTVTGAITSGTNTATITVIGSEGGSATYTVTAHKHTGDSTSGGGCYTNEIKTTTTCDGCESTGETEYCSGCVEETNCTTSSITRKVLSMDYATLAIAKDIIYAEKVASATVAPPLNIPPATLPPPSGGTDSSSNEETSTEENTTEETCETVTTCPGHEVKTCPGHTTTTYSKACGF